MADVPALPGADHCSVTSVFPPAPERPAGAPGTSSSSVIVPVASSSPRLTPDGRFAAVSVSVNSSSASSNASSRVVTSIVLLVSPTAKVSFPLASV